MFDFLTLSKTHAISILKKDHDRVKQLFDRFETADGRATREKVIAEALTELKMHTVLEEEIFYPAVRAHVGAETMNEADEEHHVAKVLIAELDEKLGDEGHRVAKFTVLAENIRHHIKEEEGEMLPKAKGTDVDFEALGTEMSERKKLLVREGVPKSAEHEMVARTPRADSPAAAAKRTRSTVKKTTQTANRARKRSPK